MNRSESRSTGNGSSMRSRPAASRTSARSAQSARTSYERYLALARATALTCDRIEAENYYQHAEHYFRSMGESNH